MAVKTIGVLGLGVFGSSIAKELSDFDCEVLAVDLDVNNVDRVEPYVTEAIQGDITDLDFLKNIGFDNCDVVVVATGTSLEASVLAVMNCKKLRINTIVAKAKNKVFMEVLYAVGATKVVRPEKEMGTRVAKNLLRRHITDIVDLDDEFAVIEFYPPARWVGRSLQELDLRKRYEMNVIGIRRKPEKRLDVSFGPDYIIDGSDIIVGIAESEIFERYDYLNKLK
ncbi:MULTISPECIES: potassium channel family protein [Carnobacterium]|uniref:Potassium channel family protein n=1 Tax=Carnobacterium antarcticum TaxID=2126436 RepID=A0ABW4NK85_9LACT|nr:MULTISPECIES: TrkA family potassium uptake protein [unclassified Carnobacterium]ALV21903.1 Trk system potassium uptake protein TrkA [Carnobacterium sp. CP1]QQP69879.1 TrkA family potassium uptake protein [Carnobacterium sp. CS13]